MEAPVILSDEEIEVSIVIDVCKGRIAVGPHIYRRAIRIGEYSRGSPEGGTGTTVIPIVINPAMPFPHKEVEIAVPIDIHQGWSAVITHINGSASRVAEKTA